MNKELNILLNKANGEIEKIKSNYMENQNAFKPMNLKLHDTLNYYALKAENDYPMFTKDELYDFFENFCDNSYNNFIEDLLLNHNIEFNSYTNQIGNTSNFYLTHNDSFKYNYIEKYGFSELINDLLNDFISYIDYEYIFTIYSDGKITLNNQTIETTADIDYVKELLQTIIDNIYNTYESLTKNIIIIYNYIKSFKDNQVAFFKEELDYQKEIREEEIQNEIKLNKMAENIKNILIESINDLTTAQLLNIKNLFTKLDIKEIE